MVGQSNTVRRLLLVCFILELIMLILIRTIITRNLTKTLVFHLVVSMLFNTFILPLVTRMSNQYIIENDISYGILLLAGYTMLEVLTKIHYLFFIEKRRNQFTINSHQFLEDHFNNWFTKLNWNTIRDLEKTQVDRIKNQAKYPLVHFIDFFVSLIIRMLPFYGYAIWLIWLSPLSMVFYLVGFILAIAFIPLPTKNYEENYKIWDRYRFLSKSLFTSVIHHRASPVVKEMGESMVQLEQEHSIRRTDQNRYTEYLNMVFNLIFVANLVLFARNMSSPSIMITYLQFTYLLQNQIHSLGHLYKEYKQVEEKYQELESLFSKHPPRQSVPQSTFQTINIAELNYVYPKKPNSTVDAPFAIKLDKPIILKRGQIIKLSGDSGHGKSTFMDILSAVIPYHEYQHQISFDGTAHQYGFDALTNCRIYAEQFESISWNPSVYEIITGIHLEHLEHSQSYPHEILVWRALCMAQCQDFLARNPDDSHKSWIHTSDINPSGGQKGRIAIARTLYNVLVSRPHMLILDEADKAFQAQTAVKIMSAIFEYCKSNDILCLVTAHTTEVQNMVFDQIIHCHLGKISIGAAD